MNNQLKVEVQCPFCGACYKRHAKESSKSIRCRFCGMSIFLRKIGKNDLGRIADEPFNQNEYVKDLNEVFE
jgi:hypothetical protein|nr:MAG TPA: RimK-related lysine biosynthesis protein, Probable-dependent amine/thiol ligase family Amino-group [Caudoviricetes sp.]